MTWLQNDDSDMLRAQFSDEEWSAIRVAPMAAAKLVIDASPSICAHLAQENAEALASIEGVAASPDPASLIGLVFRSPLSDAERAAISPDVTEDQLLGTLQKAVTLVGSRDSAQLIGYRTLIMNVATCVAEAVWLGDTPGLGPLVGHQKHPVLKQIEHALRQ